MSRVFKPRIEILPAPQQKLWPALKGTAPRGFVLYGGTAIALRLGHRASIDFDFFSDGPLDRRALSSAVPLISAAKILQETSDTVTVLSGSAKSRVKISFFAALKMGRVGQPEWTDDGVLQVASLEDLLATKLKVLLQRVEAKDYLDLAAMLDAGASLSAGLASARILYGDAFQPAECLKALTYFEGGDLKSLTHAIRSKLIAASTAVGALPRVRRASRTLAISTPASNRSRG
jgi:hypothetical protein